MPPSPPARATSSRRRPSPSVSLIGDRFRRWAGLLRIWVVSVLAGVRRTVRHWLRAIATEYLTRTPAVSPPRHAAAPTPTGRAGSTRPIPRPIPGPRPAPATGSYLLAVPPTEPRPALWPAPRGARRPSPEAAAPTTEPFWGPPPRRPAPRRDLWQAEKSSPLERAPGHQARRPAPDTKPLRHDPRPPYQPPDEQRGDQQRGDQQHRDELSGEVGGRRRRLDAYRQRPNLRVINGEGTSQGRTRSGRLRAVPRET